MSGEAQSPPDYRYMIRAFADVLDPGNAEDIQNINTAPLPNGAHCYVISRRAVFVLNKFATTSPNGTEVLQPNAGGGRWFLEGVALGLAPIAEMYATNANTFTADAALAVVTTNFFTLQEGQNLNLWALTAAGGILTYQGPAAPAVVTLTAAVQVANTDAARMIRGVISHNNDTPAFAFGTGIEGVQSVTQSVANAVLPMITERYIPTLGTGDTIRPKFGTDAAAVSGTVLSLALIARPG